MKITKSIVLLSAVSLSILQGCKKESIQTAAPDTTAPGSNKSVRFTAKSYSPELIAQFAADGVDINKLVTLYFVDGQQVQNEVADLEDKFPIFSSTKNVVDHSAIIYVRTFTTEEKYFRYGDENGLKLRENAQMDNNIYNYAVENDLLETADVEGQMPTEFYDFINAQYNQTFTPPPPLALVPGWLTTYDDIVCYGTNVSWASPMVPFMFGWRDRVGSFRRIHTYSVQVFYDRSMFRKRLGTMSGWGLSEVSFASGLVTQIYNNRIASIRMW